MINGDPFLTLYKTSANVTLRWPRGFRQCQAPSWLVNPTSYFCIRAFAWNCGQKISTSVGFTKIKAVAWKCGQKISTSVGFTKIKAVAWKCGQKIFTSVGFTKIKADAWKCGQKISTSVGFTKIKAVAWKCGQKISTSVGFTKIKAFCTQYIGPIFKVPGPKKISGRLDKLQKWVHIDWTSSVLFFLRTKHKCF